MRFLKRAKIGMISFASDLYLRYMESRSSLKKWYAGSAAAAIFCNTGVLAFAANEDIDNLGNQILTLLQSIYSQMFGIVTVLAAICAGIALIMCFAGSPQKAGQAKDWLIRIAIAYFVFCCLGLLVRTIQGITEANRFNPENFGE